MYLEQFFLPWGSHCKQKQTLVFQWLQHLLIFYFKNPCSFFWHFGVFGSMRIIYTMLLYYKEICMENIMVIFSSNSLCWCTGLYNEHCQ